MGLLSGVVGLGHRPDRAGRIRASTAATASAYALTVTAGAPTRTGAPMVTDEERDTMPATLARHAMSFNQFR
jgi:hypothetical protein